jgi:hypothetical protein
MQLRRYLKKGRNLSDDRTKICVEVGKSGEALFKELTGAVKSSLADDKKHIDFYWEDKKVDVKGLKKMHLSGFLLLEFINVWGGNGWCSKNSSAEYIAFQFPEAFYVFLKDDLRDKAIELCEEFNSDQVVRRNWIPYEEALYKWVGRYNAQDVFTYLRFEDVRNLIIEVLPYAYTEEETE